MFQAFLKQPHTEHLLITLIWQFTLTRMKIKRELSSSV